MGCLVLASTLIAAPCVQSAKADVVQNTGSSEISLYQISDCGTFWNDKVYYHDLKQHPDLDTETGRIKKGIDVSSYNGVIDWDKVAKDSEQISFAVLRIGLRGTASSGVIADDTSFDANYKGAKASGLKLGAYFFSQAISAEEAREEAEYVIDQLEAAGAKPEDFSCPIFLDVEYAAGEKPGTYTGRLYNAKLTKEQQTAICNAFAETIEKAGYVAGVYANKSMYQDHIDTSGLKAGIKIWLANYTAKTSDTPAYDFWQCSDTGKVDGISSDVDLNFYYASNAGAEGSAETNLDGKIIASVKSAGKNTVTIQWQKQENAAGYIIWRSSSRNGIYTQAGKTDAGTQTVFTDKNLEEAREYYYKIQPYVHSINNAQSILLGENGSICMASTTGTIWKRRVTTDVNFRKYAGTQVESQIIGKIPKNTTVSIQTKAKDAIGREWYKVTYGSKTGYVLAGYTVPYTSAVSGLKMISQTTSSVGMSWKKVPEADGYVVYRMTSANGKAVVAATLSGAAKTSYTDKKITTGTTYYYKIRAFRRETGYADPFYGAASSIVKMGVKVTKVSGIKQNKSKTSKNVIGLQWKKVKGASGYQIYRSSAQNGTYKKVADVSGGNTISWKDKKKSSGTEYYYKIRAYQVLNGKKYYGDFSGQTAMATKASSIRKVRTNKKTELKKTADSKGKKVVALNKKTVFSVQCQTKDAKGNTWYKGTCKVKKKTYTGYLPKSAVK